MLNRFVFIFMLVLATPALATSPTETADAYYLKGEQYFTGQAGKPDYPAAEKWYLKAAGLGHGKAALRLGFLYAENHFPGVKTDYALAEKYFTIAAEQNAGDGQFRLGNFYHYYIHPPNYEKVVYWLSKAAAGGHRIAQYDLATIYKEGHIGPPDYNQWQTWLTLAAENGVLSAQIELARAYEEGLNLDQDTDKAHYWAIKIAEHKTAPIYWVNKVADHFFAGGDFEHAAYWYQKAARKGDAHAKDRLKNIQDRDNVKNLEN